MRAVCLASMLCAAVLAAGSEVRWRTMRMDRKGWYEMRAVVPVFQGTPLGRAATDEVQGEAMAYLARFRRELTMGGRPEREASVEWGTRVSVVRDRIVSMYGAMYWYTGGAHPNRDYRAINVAVVEGKPKRIGLADLMLVRMVPEAWASRLVIPRLKEMGASSVVDGSVAALTRKQADNFVVTPAGITWMFAPYEVASYAEGEFFVKVPWSELGGLDFRGILRGLAPDPG